MIVRLTLVAIIGLVVGLLGTSGCASKSSEEDSEDVEEAVTPQAPVAETPAQEASSVALPVPEAQSEVATVPAPAAVAKPSRTVSPRAPLSGTRVMYVKVDGAVLRDSADPNGKVVSKLSKGDHLLVTFEGDWARTNDNHYVSSKVLTDKGVGRPRREAAWSAGKPALSDEKVEAKKPAAKKQEPSAEKSKDSSTNAP